MNKKLNEDLVESEQKKQKNKLSIIRKGNIVVYGLFMLMMFIFLLSNLIVIMYPEKNYHLTVPDYMFYYAGFTFLYFIFESFILKFFTDKRKAYAIAVLFSAVWISLYLFYKSLESPILFFVLFVLLSILFIATIVTGLALSFGRLTKENFLSSSIYYLTWWGRAILGALMALALVSLMHQYFWEFFIWLEYGDVNALVMKIDTSTAVQNRNAIFNLKNINAHCIDGC